MSHAITLSQPFHSPLQELNYACYKNKNYAFRFDRLRDRYYFLLCNNLITHEQCTPEFMKYCIDLFGSGWSLKHFIKILGEDNIPEFIKIYAMEKDYQGDSLGLLQHPSNKVIDAALKTTGQSIKYVQNPTEQQKLLAIRCSTESPDLIRKISKPTIQMQKIHVSRYLDGINYIKNPSESVKIVAAKAHGIEILPHIENPSEQVLLIAINYTYSVELNHFLRYIPHPNHKILCAIRHQINKCKKQHQQWSNEPANKTNQCSCVEKLNFLRQTLHLSGHIEEVIKIENKYYHDETAQIKALNELYEQTHTNPFIELRNQEIIQTH